MFITRTISGIVLLAVTMCAIIASGPLLYLFMLLISLVGMYELYRVFQMEKKIPHDCWLSDINRNRICHSGRKK